MSDTRIVRRAVSPWEVQDHSDPDFDLTSHLARVHYEVESRHHTLGSQCTCGFTSHIKRDHTQHIVTETLIAAGLEERQEQ